MSVESLISEGEKLARPCIQLVEESTSTGILAYWRGEGRKTGQGRPDDTHRITFDCDWLSKHGLKFKGSIGVYDINPHHEWVKPLRIDRIDSPLAKLQVDGTPLFGNETNSFPPIESLCLYGGPVVDDWLKSEGLDRVDYDDAALTKAGEAYQQEFIRRSPLHQSKQPVAILGGWHAFWSDDEFYLPREMRLMLWTFREAEPWIELFERFPNIHTRLRIT